METQERTEGKEGPGEALGAGTGAEAGVENECTRRKRRGAESWSVLPHALVFFQNYPWKQSSKPHKYHNQAAFVLILKKRKMAKERGLISPSDFAQLQKYMECESFSHSVLEPLPLDSPSSSSLPPAPPLCPSGLETGCS